MAIEKKPLFHFYPGSRVLSFGTAGCNLRCSYCQNYGISRIPRGMNHLTPRGVEGVIEATMKRGAEGIASTYNEPTITWEFSYDLFTRARKEGLYTVWVSNGYINPEPLEAIAPVLDAINVDLKSFNPQEFKKVSKGDLERVKETLVKVRELGLHLEVTHLLVPDYNDDPAETRAMAEWLVTNVGAETPLHITRFHPDYEMNDRPETPQATLRRAYTIASEVGLRYVFLGNITDRKRSSTYCPHCGSILVSRDWHFIRGHISLEGKCKHCGADVPVIGRWSRKK